MTVGSLFSGIGGLDLGLEWAGMETEWFCEIEPYAQEVLKRHWPDKAIISDIRDINEEALAEGSIRPVDIIAGGFPCQDLSWAGKGAGLSYDLSSGEGTRSGLWWEMWRVIRLFRPRYVIAENVPALTHRGLDVVLGSLAQIGYDAEWQTISAASVGAPHIRERVFIVAYCGGERRQQEREGSPGDEAQDGRRKGEDHEPTGCNEGRDKPCSSPDVADIGTVSWFGGTWGQPWPVSFKRGEDVGNATDLDAQGERPRTVEPQEDSGAGRGKHRRTGRRTHELERVASIGDVRGVADGLSGGVEQERGGVMWPTPAASGGDTGGPVGLQGGAGNRAEWQKLRDEYLAQNPVLEDHIYTDAPNRTGRLKGLGNAVVPQVGYLVGSAVMEHDKERRGG